MGRLVVVLMLAAVAAACARPPDQTSSDSPSAESSVSPTVTAAPVDPDRVKRVRADLPEGYEVTDVGGAAAPADYWGLKPGGSAAPLQCGALADPAHGAVGRGLSGSGDGGLVHIVAAALPPGLPRLDPALLAECAQWSLVSGGSTASVTTTPGPQIAGAATVAMEAAITTVVESGTETDSVAHTFTAYLDGGLVLVALIVDPGSPHPPLPAQYAAELLVKTVSAVRG